MARLYADNDFNEHVSAELRRLGHDIISAPQVGRSRDSDDEALDDATQIGCPIITHNRWDFVRLHRRNQNHAGIISCTQDIDLLALAARIHSAVTAAGDLTGQHIRVNRPP